MECAELTEKGVYSVPGYEYTVSLLDNDIPFGTNSLWQGRISPPISCSIILETEGEGELEKFISQLWKRRCFQISCDSSMMVRMWGVFWGSFPRGCGVSLEC